MSHIPVMLKESLEMFEGRTLSLFFDATLGSGGFAKALLRAHPEVKTYFGCDRDPDALELSRENLKEFGGRVELIYANFCDVRKLLEERGVNKVDGFFLI